MGMGDTSRGRSYDYDDNGEESYTGISDKF